MSEEHLGDEIHDLLDNRLSSARSAEAMRHLDSCPDCRMRWDDLRAAREALRTASAGIDMSFSQGLLDRDRIAEIASTESRSRARAAKGRDRRPAVAMLVVLAVLTFGVSASYVAGAPEEVSLEFAESAAPRENAVMWVGAHSMRGGDELRSWVHPNWEATGLEPIEAIVVRNGAGKQVLVATILADFEEIVVTEQHGRLVATLDDHYPSVSLGHTDAYLVRERPRQLVWQTGDVVISVTCTCAMTTLEAVATTFPAQGEPGFVDRVVDGFRELAGSSGPEN